VRVERGRLVDQVDHQVVAVGLGRLPAEHHRHCDDQQNARDHEPPPFFLWPERAGHNPLAKIRWPKPVAEITAERRATV
jgi:hypothetical protein